VLVVERVDQLHCVLQIVKAMPLVMFPAPSFPSDEISRFVPSIDQDPFFPHNLLHVAFAIRLQFVLDCWLRVGCWGLGGLTKVIQPKIQSIDGVRPNRTEVKGTNDLHSDISIKRCRWRCCTDIWEARIDILTGMASIPHK
jgi:hypothetical protein